MDYEAIISGRDTGVTAALARAFLSVLSPPYRATIALRNVWYDRLAMLTWLEAPVISVGNLTTGGTGKTPMTIWLCERLLERRRKPAVLSRGYKGGAAGPDELLLISRRVPAAICIANPNRAASGELAIQEFAARAAVLDDGFQHRRLGRDLDIVLIDATEPFGYGHLLPRGRLREPVKSLRRAEAIVITRADQADPAAISRIERTVRRYKPEVPIARAVHRAGAIVDLAGAPAGELTGRVGAFAAIARPQAFERTLADIGISPGATRWFPDHHAYTADDVKELGAWAAQAGLDALVTTEKDAVKLARLEADWPVPVRVLRVDIEFLDGGDKILADLIDAMLRDHEENHGAPAEAQT